MTVDALERDVDIARRALKQISDRLPAGWSVTVAGGDALPDLGADVAELSAADQVKTVLVMQVRRTVEVRELSGIAARLQTVAGARAGSVPVVVARYLSPSARKWLQDRDLSYVDTTGNLRVVSSRPALYLADRGADKDPWRGPGRPLADLQGPAAARVVRALTDLRTPMTTRELIKASGTSTGTTYRVLEFLRREDLIVQEPRGPIRSVQWRKLIERWSRDYGFLRSNAVGQFLAPRGLPRLFELLAENSNVKYVLSGSFAAHQWSPYATARAAMLYVADMEGAAEALQLRRSDAGTNVLLAATDYAVVFDRSVEVDGIRYAAPAQVAVDLMTGPGRNPAEAESLLDWMEANEPAWRG